MTQLNSDAVRTASAERRRTGVVRTILRTAPFPALFWLTLSGHYDWLFLALGLVSIATVCWLVARAGLDRHGVTLPFVARLPVFVVWLSWQAIVSAWSVVRKVWSPRLELRPVVASTPADMPVWSQVIYANSITLTPGTLALYIGDDYIKVHSLEQADVDVLGNGRMLSRVRQTETHR
jgi:multicomponent Na+:H+ antiporter subunit E